LICLHQPCCISQAASEDRQSAQKNPDTAGTIRGVRGCGIVQPQEDNTSPGLGAHQALGPLLFIGCRQRAAFVALRETKSPPTGLS
jgi:hypothetical protein